MSIQVNSLIQNSFQRCSLVGDGQTVDGTKTRAALQDLKSVIAKLNEQNLILSDVKCADTTARDFITFAVLPENWKTFNNYETAELVLNNLNVGDILKFKEPHEGKHFFCVVSFTLGEKSIISSDEFEKKMQDYWPTFAVKELPDRVLGVGRKIANRYIQLAPATKMRIDSYLKCGLASEYCIETENIYVEPIMHQELAQTVQRLKIELNAGTAAPIRVTYLEGIPDIEIDDTLYISNMYENLLEDGLCAELCLRYKLMDLKDTFEEEFANSIRLIKRVNQANRPQQYDFIEKGSYMDNYYNGFCPAQWG